MLWRELITAFDSLLSQTVNYEAAKHQLLVNSLQFAWLHHLFQLLPHRTQLPAAQKDARVVHACEFIGRHLAEQLTSVRIAESVYLSPNYLRTLFQNELKITPFEYVRLERLKKAQQLLLSSQAPVREIGEWVGIQDPSEFSRIFKEKFKLSPLQYRKKWKSSLYESEIDT